MLNLMLWDERVKSWVFNLGISVAITQISEFKSTKVAITIIDRLYDNSQFVDC